jgi:membrane fusion protein (multidrug efflux system)
VPVYQTGEILTKMKKMYISRLLTSALALFFIFLAACGDEQATPERPAPGVMISNASTQLVKETAEFIGRTEAINDVQIRARVQGYLLERNFTEGDNVNVGDKLFVIESDTYQAEVAAAEGDVERAEAEVARTQDDLKRYEKLFKSQNISEQDISKARNDKLQAEANLTSSQARRLGAQTDLNNTIITAPIKGRIGRSIASVGNLIDMGGEPLARIVELDPMYVSINVSERILIEIKEKQIKLKLKDNQLPDIDVQLRMPNNQLYSMIGKLDFVDNVVDTSTATVHVRAKFSNPDELLIPGMFVRLLVGREEKTQALTIPEQAIQEDQAGKYVMIVDSENVVDVRRIKTGRADKGRIKIIDGLQEGESVVVEGMQKIRPGVTVTTRIAPLPSIDGN